MQLVGLRQVYHVIAEEVYCGELALLGRGVETFLDQEARNVLKLAVFTVSRVFIFLEGICESVLLLIDIIGDMES